MSLEQASGPAEPASPGDRAAAVASGPTRWRSGWALLAEVVLLALGPVLGLTAFMVAVFGSLACGLDNNDEPCTSGVRLWTVLLLVAAGVSFVGGIAVWVARHRAGARARDSWMAVVTGLVTAFVAAQLTPTDPSWLPPALGVVVGATAGGIVHRFVRRRRRGDADAPTVAT